MGKHKTRDREKLFKDLLEWAKLDDSINLCEFCSSYCEPPIAPAELCTLRKENERYTKAYDIAKSFIGARREKLLSEGKIHVKAYDLNANTYDYFLKEERRAEKEYEANLNKSHDDAEINVNIISYDSAEKNETL